MDNQAMKRIIDRIAALSTAFYLLAALILWLAVGIALARLPQTESVFEQMNRKLILEWLMDASPKDWQVLAWFIGLCLLNLALFVNLLLCSLTRLSKRPITGKRAKSRLLFFIHILVLFIMLGHLANMVVGYKYAHIRMAPGTSHTLPNGDTIFLDHVHYACPVKYLMMDPHEARQSLTRERFDIEQNYAGLRLIRENGETSAGTVYRLKPLKDGPLRITLNRFFLAEKPPQARVGAVLTVAENPIHEAFFLIYAFTILCFLIYLIIYREPQMIRSMIPGAKKALPGFIRQKDEKCH